MLVCVFGHAQELPTLVPQSPEVSSLLKYVETPVSYHTGIPNISVPLASINGRDLSASVSVSYHAGGHRVAEEATKVGLGWSLIAGGQITRTVRGFEDDHLPYGFIHNPTTVSDVIAFCSAANQACAHYTGTTGKTQRQDLEPDDFNYSMMGLSGRFMFDQNRDISNPKGRVIQFPNKNMLIKPNFHSTNGRILSWDITDTNGTIYHFEVGNVFVKSQTFEYVNNRIEIPVDGLGNGNSYTETWNLTKVTSLTGDEITLEYETPKLSWSEYNDFNCSFSDDRVILKKGGALLSGLITSGSQQNNGGGAGNQETYPKRVTSYTSVYRNEQILKKIISSKGYIEFIKSSTLRQDRQSEKHSLEYIRVYSVIGSGANKTIKKIKEVQFFQDYFIGEKPKNNEFVHTYSGGSESILANTDSFLNKRLRLNKIQFNELVNNNETPKNYDYTFSYNNEVNLPHKRSYKQDAWGYFNGIDNATLIPKFDYTSYYSSNATIVIPNFPHGNREVNPKYSNANVLESIKYPEGGKTVFKFENNRGDVKTKKNKAYLEESFTLNGLVSSQHNIINSGGGYVTYKIYDFFNIPLDAKDAPGDITKTQVEYNGFTNRCENVDAFYTDENLVCNNMFFKIYKENSTIPLIKEPIWRLGTISLDKGHRYKLEIEIKTLNEDYSFASNFSKVDLKWFKKNPNPTVEYFDFFGGLRVKEVLNYSGLNLVKHKSFKYEKGHILSEPIFYVITVSNFHQLVSQSWVPLISTHGAYVNYKKVKEIFHKVKPELELTIDVNSRSNNPTNIKFFSNASIVNNPSIVIPPTEEYITREYLQASTTMARLDMPFVGEWTSGRLSKVEIMDKQTKTITNSIYGNENENNIKGIPTTYKRLLYQDIKEQLTTSKLLDYNIWPGISLPTKNETITFFGENKTLKENETISYEGIPNHYNPTKIITNKSNEKSKVNITNYPYELNNTILLNQNKINTLLESKVYENDNQLSHQKTVYPSQGTLFNLYLPSKVQTLKGVPSASNILKDRVIYHSYDAKGNPTEVSKKDGTHIVYLWGYNQTQPVAKIENATLSDVSSYISNIQNLSNIDKDVASEAILRTALNALRNVPTLSKAQITTYTYNPLIGVTSITDPRGQTIYYEYDGFNRLEFVKDKDKNILKENQYNYKN